MFCPYCGKKMTHDCVKDKDYDFCYSITKFFSCDSCDITVEKTVIYGDGQPEDVFFSITDKE